MLDAQNLGAFIVTVVTLPFVIILLICILVLARSARKATASTRWPTTSGRILTSDVGSYRSLNSSGTHTTIYEPNIVYEYTVNGQRFESKQVNYGAVAGTSSTDWADATVDKYPQGSVVQVFYDPAKPSEAVLEHAGSSGNLALMAVLIVVELILVGLILVGLTGHFG